MNKIQEIIDHLSTEIEKSHLKPGEKIPSEYKLSEMFNVNKTTANKAVACLVNQKVLKRLKGPAGTIVNRPNLYPKGRIGFLISPIKLGFFAKILSGAQSAAFSRRYSLTYFNWPKIEEYNEFWECFSQEMPDGLLLSGGTAPDGLNMPIVYADCMRKEDSKDSYVTNDNLAGGCLIAKSLIEMGHKNIAYVTSAGQALHMKMRGEGFKQAMTEHKLEFRSYPMQSIHVTIDAILKEIPGVTAIAFDSDLNASKGIACLERKGLRTPEDISITGFAALSELEHASSITSVDQHPFQIGYQAAESLIDILEGRQKEPVRKMIPVELFPGNTVKKLNGLI